MIAFIPVVVAAFMLFTRYSKTNLVIVIILFGASRLPQIGRGLGEGISNFKKSMRTAEKNGTSESQESKSKS